VTVRWLTAFIDRPADQLDLAMRFWSEVTGSAMSPMRGDHDEFATLLPPDGDAYLRIQRVADGVGGSHLDLHVDDITATAMRAGHLGARVTRELDDVIVMRSPAGMAFCVVDHDGESTRPAPTALHGSTRAIVDQLCIDIPRVAYESECEFWSDLTGWEHRQGVLPEFSYLRVPAGMPIRLLLQRQDDSPAGNRAGAHLDLACDDVEAAAAIHQELGAQLRARHEHWITMTDPAGLPYCLTRRDPDTGTVSG
jgi:predicted enzyme related to lactoylglutathione lyase